MCLLIHSLKEYDCLRLKTTSIKAQILGGKHKMSRITSIEMSTSLKSYQKLDITLSTCLFIHCFKGYDYLRSKSSSIKAQVSIGEH